MEKSVIEMLIDRKKEEIIKMTEINYIEVVKSVKKFLEVMNELKDKIKFDIIEETMKKMTNYNTNEYMTPHIIQYISEEIDEDKIANMLKYNFIIVLKSTTKTAYRLNRI